MDTQSLSKELLAKRIAGEIVLSVEAGKVIQKWRNIFKIPQRRLADEMKIMPSVISDYENGRRKSPGIKVVKRIVSAMIVLDEKAGSKIIEEFATFPTKNVLSDAVLDMRDFNEPIVVKDFCKNIDAPIVVRQDLMERKLHGYTVIDPMKAIVEFSPIDMVKLHTLTTDRALVFSGAHRGRSAMVAVKIMNLRPGLVILHGAEGIDELAKRIAELEDVPVGLTKIKDIAEVIKNLKKL